MDHGRGRNIFTWPLLTELYLTPKHNISNIVIPLTLNRLLLFAWCEMIMLKEMSILFDAEQYYLIRTPPSKRFFLHTSLQSCYVDASRLQIADAETMAALT